MVGNQFGNESESSFSEIYLEEIENSLWERINWAIERKSKEITRILSSISIDDSFENQFDSFDIFIDKSWQSFSTKRSIEYQWKSISSIHISRLFFLKRTVWFFVFSQKR